MRDDIETQQVGKYTVRVVQDTDPMSPREWSSLGTMVCWHRNYILGDKHTFASPQEFRESLEYLDAAIVLPLYLYDHSGITMSTRTFSCPWDSGQVGYIYVTKERVRKEYSRKRITKKTLALATEVLRQEVKTYDEYLTGQVYGFIVEDADGEQIDSCFGFYGEVKEVLAEGVSSAKHQIAEDAKIDRMMPDTASVESGDAVA